MTNATATATIANFSLFANASDKFTHALFEKTEGQGNAVKKEVKADYTVKGGGKDGAPVVTGSGLKIGNDKNGAMIRDLHVSLKSSEGKYTNFYGKLFSSTVKEQAKSEGKAGADNLPDYFGSARKSGDEAGVEYRMSGWLKVYQDKASGEQKNYISVCLQEPYAGAVDPEPAATAAVENDDVPF